MVGAFKTDEALPLLARYVGGLPSTGTATSNYKDMGIRFPTEPQRAIVEKGREPKGETVISYYAEPPANDPMEQERALAAVPGGEIMEPGSHDHRAPPRTHRRPDRRVRQGRVQQVLPGGSHDDSDAAAAEAITDYCPYLRMTSSTMIAAAANEAAKSAASHRTIFL